MTLRTAFQMDPIESVKIAGDSSFALMLSAQERGHEVWHYDVESLAWESDGSHAGKITAFARPVRVKRVEGDHYEWLGERRVIDLAKDIDVVWLRQDPPFDLGYITAAFLLDRLKGTTLVVNDPREVVNAPEKMFVLDYARFMPPTLVARASWCARSTRRLKPPEHPTAQRCTAPLSLPFCAARLRTRPRTARSLRRARRWPTLAQTREHGSAPRTGSASSARAT